MYLWGIREIYLRTQQIDGADYARAGISERITQMAAAVILSTNTAKLSLQKDKEFAIAF